MDELALFTARGEKKACAQFSTLTEDLVARGRAAGIIVVAATQRPSHDIIPTSLRDLFAFRWAMRCSTPQASDTILGQGWASQGFSATNIDAAERGVGFLLHEGGLPIRLRSYYLADEHLESIAARAEALRRQVTGQAAVQENGRV
jgi:S-DNA-T family DNA segregation ATPase FtsK/SpoIIIE